MEETAPPLVRAGDETLRRRAEELGIDLGLLEENLALSPLARMRQHDESVRQVLAARQRLGIPDDDEA